MITTSDVPWGSISPLPPEYRQCQTAIFAVGVLSLCSTILLWLHITYKLILWKIKDVRAQRLQSRDRAQTAVDLSLGLTENQYYQARYNKAGAGPDTASPIEPRGPLVRSDTFLSQPAPAEADRTASTPRQKPPNPLLLLIYNLIFSDMWLSAAYISNLVWVQNDAIDVSSPTCKYQGWVISFGCLTASGFLFCTAIFSYATIIRGNKPSSKVVVMAITAVWVLALLLSTLGMFFVRDGSFFGRETLWCWISSEHSTWRLSIWIWGFGSACGTCSLYSIIFYRLWREGRSSRYMPRRPGSDTSAATRRPSTDGTTPLRPSGHHPAFLVYPCIFTFTATPLLLGSVIPSLEASPFFMGCAGALLACTGFLDSLLWSSIIVFSRKEDMINVGLDQFSFMRTPEGRTLGNFVFVQGGNNARSRQSWHSKKDKGWWRLKDRAGSNRSLPLEQHGQGAGEGGIQMDIVTSIVVEGRGSNEQSRDGSMDRGDGGAKQFESQF